MKKSELKKTIRDSLGLNDKKLNEAYVVQAQKYRLPTELLSEKNKAAHQELMENYVKSLNEVSARLDSVDKDEANLNYSEFRSLKIDEVYNLNAAFLHAMFFENVSDVNSVITMDSMAFMRLERDFGSFENWQKDFIACGLSARNGWVVTVYNSFLRRYMNVVVDLHHQNIPFGSFVCIVVDCWEHSYCKDYLKDRKTYLYAMMKELNWKTIENRFNKAEKINKVIS